MSTAGFGQVLATAAGQKAPRAPGRLEALDSLHPLHKHLSRHFLKIFSPHHKVIITALTEFLNSKELTEFLHMKYPDRSEHFKKIMLFFSLVVLEVKLSSSQLLGRHPIVPPALMCTL
jgi:hypothetical protein